MKQSTQDTLISIACGLVFAALVMAFIIRATN
jgi:hypothetical protein